MNSTNHPLPCAHEQNGTTSCSTWHPGMDTACARAHAPLAIRLNQLSRGPRVEATGRMGEKSPPPQVGGGHHNVSQRMGDRSQGACCPPD